MSIVAAVQGARVTTYKDYSYFRFIALHRRRHGCPLGPVCKDCETYYELMLTLGTWLYRKPQKEDKLSDPSTLTRLNLRGTATPASER